MLDRRNAEMAELKNEVASKNDVNHQLRDDLKNLEEDVEMLHSAKRANSLEIDRLLGLNEGLSKDYADAAQRAQDLELDLNRANGRIRDLDFAIE